MFHSFSEHTRYLFAVAAMVIAAVMIFSWWMRAVSTTIVAIKAPSSPRGERTRETASQMPVSEESAPSPLSGIVESFQGLRVWSRADDTGPTMASLMKTVGGGIGTLGKTAVKSLENAFAALYRTFSRETGKGL